MHVGLAVALLVGAAFVGAAAAQDTRKYENRLTPIKDSKPLLADYPDFIDKTTAGYQNLSKDFNVFLVGDATLATFPANSSPRFATNAAISFAALDQLVTQVSWVQYQQPKSDGKKRTTETQRHREDNQRKKSEARGEVEALSYP
jgi:hypothetical protein